MKDRIQKLRTVVYSLAPIVSALVIGLPIVFGIIGGGKSGGG